MTDICGQYHDTILLLVSWRRWRSFIWDKLNHKGLKYQLEIITCPGGAFEHESSLVTKPLRFMNIF